MTDSKTDHPFVPGARVAIYDRWDNNRVTEGFVDKVYKTGNFTLCGDKQQWSPYRAGSDDRPKWRAVETSGGYSRRRLDLWDETADAEITAKVEASKARDRWRKLIVRIERVKEPTAALCDAVEAAVAILNPQEPK